MNTESLYQRLSADEYAALFDAARQGALEARREASREFWSGVARAAGSLWRALRPAAVAAERDCTAGAATRAAAARKRASDLQAV